MKLVLWLDVLYGNDLEIIYFIWIFSKRNFNNKTIKIYETIFNGLIILK